MIRKITNKLLILIIVFSFLGVTGKSEAAELTFSVETEIPENQVDKNRTYFDLQAQAGQTQELSVLVHNLSDKDIEIEQDIAAATTNINGDVDYSSVEVEKDPSLIYDLSDLLKYHSGKEKLKIPKASSVPLKFKLTYPKEKFEGVIAGGITFTEKKTESKNNKSEGTVLENQVAYAVAVVLHGEELKETPKLALEKVSIGQVNSRNVINGKFVNPTPKYINQLTIEAKVTHRDKSDLLYEIKEEGMQMAPNSNFEFPLRMKGKRFEDGEYTYTAIARSGDEEWTFTEDFTIIPAVADELNAKDVSLEAQSNNHRLWWMIGIAVLVIGILVVIVMLLLHAKKNKKKKRKKRKKERRKNKSEK